jgi:hypothetical protein
MATEQWKSANQDKMREYRRIWYARHRDFAKERARTKRAELQSSITEYKAQQGIKCARCGEDHPAVLDFHHREPTQKEMNISNLASRGWSLTRIIAEIDKCDVLCANCHRKLHWEERQLLVGTPSGEGSGP